MKKNIIKFIIIFSLIFSISDSKVFAQISNKIISGEKLEKLLTENTILISENIHYFNYHSAEWKFNKYGTYSVNPPNDSETYRNPNFGTWKITGLSNNSLILTDYRKIKDKQFQFYFGEDGYIYRGAEKIYSYKSENIKEKIYREAEEKRIAEELRLKKIEEEKRQLAIKREQERIKAEQIKKDEEKRRFELEEYLKKQEEERIKRQNEERIKLEREELYKNILKYSLITIFFSILSFVIYKYRARIKDEFYPKFIKYLKNIRSNKKEFYPKFIEYIKDIKTNPDKKVGFQIIGIIFVAMVLSIIFLSDKKSSKYATNVCDDVVYAMKGFIELGKSPTAPKANINSLINEYNQAKSYSRSFNDNPTMYTNLCAGILTNARYLLWPR